MKNCCDAKASELQKLPARQRRVLWIILAINLAMFFVEGAAGLIARSTSLLADSLDMAGDAFVYGISLYAIGRSARWNASISLFKGALMGAFGIGVFAQAYFRFRTGLPPESHLMGSIGTLALAANVASAILLFRHRDDDINMHSSWLCTFNDVIANLGVLAAAAAVSATGSPWPDLIVGSAIAVLVLVNSAHVLKDSWRQLRLMSGISTS